MVTALLVGRFATVVLGCSWPDGLLLGAIISSTDATAVFGVRRSKRMALKGELQPLLEGLNAMLRIWTRYYYMISACMVVNAFHMLSGSASYQELRAHSCDEPRQGQQLVGRFARCLEHMGDHVHPEPLATTRS
jgi:hypothetical protein